jgi:hypothetical protein
MQDLIGQGLRWLNDLFGTIHIKVPGLADSSAASSVMQWLLYGAGIAGAVICLALLWARLSQLKKQSEGSRKHVSSITRVLDSSGWQKEAEQLATASKWREACRALYLSFLQLLHERGISEFVPTRTNYEYWHALAKHSSLQRRFRTLVNPVEAIWFGSQPASQNDYKLCLTALKDLQSEVALVTPTATGASESKSGLRTEPADFKERD